MNRAYYAANLLEFLQTSDSEVLGHLLARAVSVDGDQGPAWGIQLPVLREALRHFAGDKTAKIYFEWAVPRVGKRIDVVVVLRNVVFVIEFKNQARQFLPAHRDQVWDYALDLKNFHETSHETLVAPILVATDAEVPGGFGLAFTAHDDRLYCPIDSNAASLARAISAVLADAAMSGSPTLDPAVWEMGRYRPTPTIIEAARALYGGHGVADITKNEAENTNLAKTSVAIDRIIESAKARNVKSICFVTGVPGAGKTLVGLKVATDHSRANDQSHSTFLSGNDPLVKVMTEALARDKAAREKAAGRKPAIGEARRAVSAFIQIVHRFRDEYIRDRDRPPVDHVVIFDEAQRAWDLKQTAFFMKRKKGIPNFTQSEPEFLISCMDRHSDWAVIVCLVGGGQEINTGEVGIAEWIDSILRSFPSWEIHISPNLRDSEYGAGAVLARVERKSGVTYNQDLHLAVSMRSFRAENVSAFVKAVLDHEEREARRLLAEVKDLYPITLTRDLQRAKNWLRERARGTERYGVLVSSEAQRLKPHAIDVRTPMNPVHWFLGPKEDVRSSYYLEDVATQFHVQGLELDWAAVVWDGDLRAIRGRGRDGCWGHHSFVGTKWHKIVKPDGQNFLKNAYRVLLTRARQGMVIVVPEGDSSDPTRDSAYYDPTFQYLAELGLAIL